MNPSGYIYIYKYVLSLNFRVDGFFFNSLSQGMQILSVWHQSLGVLNGSCFQNVRKNELMMRFFEPFVFDIFLNGSVGGV